MPFIAFKAWAIVKGHIKEIQYAKIENERKEIASLTKLTTAYVCIKLVEQLDINVTETKTKVLDRQH